MMNEDLVKEVKSLVDEVGKTHRYSMSKIYGLYNKVFETNETPQSCASCLIRKIRGLETWLKGYDNPKSSIGNYEGSEAISKNKPMKKKKESESEG